MSDDDPSSAGPLDDSLADTDPWLARDRDAWLHEAPFWALSAVLHLVLVAVLVNVMIEAPARPKEHAPMRLRLEERARVRYEPTWRRDLERRPKLPEVKLVEKPVLLRRLDDVTPEVPRGTDLSNLTNLELLHSSVHDVIGAAGGASGAYGQRWGKGSLIREGGSEGTEEAVRAALEWLRRHQAPDGSWSSDKFVEQCRTRCASRDVGRGDGRGERWYDVGVTGLAVLAFAGYGHTHVDGVFPEYVECLRRAVRWLKRQQVRSNDPAESGRYGGTGGHWPYNHAIATMAMSELLVMSRDVIGLGRSVEDAVELILHSQNPGAAWRYEVRDGDNDTSVTGWMILALKAARNAPIDIEARRYDLAFEDALRFIRSVTDDEGRAGYQRRGNFRTRLHCMTSVAVLGRLFAGESREGIDIRRGVDVCMLDLPRWNEGERGAINMYHWYYASYALFQYGGTPWRRWNIAMKHALLQSQRRGGEEDGSWDPIGDWGPRGGRVYSTAIGAMTLEVYYRFLRVTGAE